MLRIGIVSPDDHSTTIFARPLARAFRQRGEAEIVTMSPIVQGFEGEIGTISDRHIRIPMERFVSPLQDLRFFLSVWRACKKESFGILITFTTKPNVFATVAARIAGVPKVVCAVRGLGTPFAPPVTGKDRILSAVVRLLYSIAGRVSDLVWFTNPNDRAEMVFGGMVPERKTLLTPNGVDLTFWSMSNVDPEAVSSLRRKLEVPKGHRTVVMVARLIWSKGVREFVEAARAAHETDRPWTFILVAPEERTGGEAVPVEFVRAAEREANFRWLGFRRDVRELFALADVAVLPSYYREGGYPRALLEPMALGKPVVASDTEHCRGPVAEGENGLLVPPGDALALLGALEHILETDGVAQRFGDASRMRVEKLFDDRVIAGMVLDSLGPF